ncbi:MAG TPA: hypothetical protein VHP11_09905, partial [Tepidisphaeraceae bacterium]|nr:hypothetical protein [Tepidisphaeraceae bacterium]
MASLLGVFRSGRLTRFAQHDASHFLAHIHIGHVPPALNLFIPPHYPLSTIYNPSPHRVPRNIATPITINDADKSS